MTTLDKEPATLTRPIRVPDGRGGHNFDYDSPSPTDLGLVLFAPAGPRENLGDREHSVRYAGTVYAKPAVDVRPADAVTVRDTRYRVLGQPQQWQIGTVIELERWEG